MFTDEAYKVGIYLRLSKDEEKAEKPNPESSNEFTFLENAYRFTLTVE